MTTREEFILKAKSRGLNKEQTKQAMAMRRQKIGAFDDDEKERNLFGLSDKAEKAVFPTTSEMKGVGGAVLQGLEALGTPVRMLGKLRSDPETGEKFKTSDPQSAVFRPEMEKIKSKIPGEGFLPKVGRGAVEIAGSIASDPTLPLTGLAKVGSKFGGKFIKKAIEAPNKMAGHFAKELSGVSEEALRMAGTKGGRKTLEAAAGTQMEIGKRILKNLDDFQKFIPEKKSIENALNNMPQIGTKKTIKVLKDAIDGFAVGKGKDANKQISKMIDDISKKGKKLTASQFLGLRKRIDNEIGDSWGKDANAYITALKDARHQMKEMLIRAGEKSGNPEYLEAMTSLANKMDAVDRLKGYIGKSDKARSRKIESFVANVFGRNKTEAQQTLKDIGEVFGENFLEESKIARLAGELGEGGKAAFLPRQTTGRSLLSVGPQILLGSPSLSSRFTLPMATATEKGAKRFFSGSQKALSKVSGIPGAASAVSPKKEVDIESFKNLKFY